MIKATLAAAAVFSFILQVPPASPVPSSPAFFLLFVDVSAQSYKKCKLFACALRHQPERESTPKPEPKPDPATLPVAAWLPHRSVSARYATLPCCSVTSSPANLEAKAQRVKSKRFNIYGTLYGLWAYFKTPPQHSLPRSLFALPVSLPVRRQQQMMLFRQAHRIYSRLYFDA